MAEAADMGVIFHGGLGSSPPLNTQLITYPDDKILRSLRDCVALSRV